jgi:hypothetical protein
MNCRVIAILFVSSLLIVSCGEDPPPPPSIPACANNSGLRLVGWLDGDDVDYREQLYSASVTNGSPGVFEVTPVSSRPNGLVVNLTWERSLFNGESGPARGTFTMPAGGPSAGRSFCAGEGSEVGFAGGENGQFQYRLNALTVAPACTTPVRGALAGCWN